MTKLAMFNQLKKLALSLDGVFKSTGQTQVKFHQVMAAVVLTVSEKIQSSDDAVINDYSDRAAVAKKYQVSEEALEAVIDQYVTHVKNDARQGVLRRIFNNNAQDPNETEMNAFCNFILEVANGVCQANDDRALNNVLLTIDRADATTLVQVVQPQLEVFNAAGNDLPRLHITHGNSPITAASYDDVLTFIDATGGKESALYEHLKQYGLDLDNALKTTVDLDLFDEVFITSDHHHPFPTYRYDTPTIETLMRNDLEESEKNLLRKRHYLAAMRLITSDKNDWPTPYSLEKRTTNDYQRPLARFFAWIAYADLKGMSLRPRFVALYTAFPDSAKSAGEAAVLFNKNEILNELFAITPPEKRPLFIKQCLITAAATNNVHMLQLLLEMTTTHCISIEDVINDPHGALERPMTECIRQNQLEALRFLLEHGVKPDYPSNIIKMDSILRFAVRSGSLDAVNLLIIHGANVDYVCEFGYTALYDAIQGKHWDIAKRLIEAGARIVTSDKPEQTIFDRIDSEEKRAEVLSWFPQPIASTVASNRTNHNKPIENTSSIPTTTRPFSLKGIHFWAGSSNSVVSSVTIDDQKVQKDLTEILKKSDEQITASDQADLNSAGIKFL